MKTVAVIGGGPAGLRAAEVAASLGAQVTLFDAKSSVGRKFLVAGKGGLNITKAEPLEKFLSQYGGPDLPRERWNEIVRAFPPEALREWAARLGVETFAASTGRVYPREMKAAPLLRRWVQRLRTSGVQFAMRHRWRGLKPGSPITLHFDMDEGKPACRAEAVILAMGGGSWPETGSDGHWMDDLRKCGVALADLAPANCGWEVDWPPGFLESAEGLPLKNITASAGGATARGELMVTRYGLEGGIIYQLGGALRGMDRPVIQIDLKPSLEAAELIRKLGPLRANFLHESRTRWKLGDAPFALLRFCAPSDSYGSAAALAATAKSLSLALKGPRPIAEAISSAGGVRWSELDDDLMIRALPGVFCAGEMIDWEAPTGGYLMQGCFATGTHAGAAAAKWVTTRA